MKLLFTGVLLLLFFRSDGQEGCTVYFDFNKHYLTQKAKAALDSFLLNEKTNLPAYQLELHGHCDFIGGDNYNLLLSEKRVAAVKKYLLSKAVAPDKFSNLKGHGEKQPLNENRNEEERQLNRRVEIRISQKKELSLKEKISDSTTTAGTNVVLKNINFVGGRSIFLPGSQQSLDELLDAVKAYPRLMIRVEGHICCIEGPEDGPDLGTGFSNLSEARAKAVRDWLIENGIAASRVSYKGLGHSTPLYPWPENTEDEKTGNRRVEIKIISK